MSKLKFNLEEDAMKTTYTKEQIRAIEENVLYRKNGIGLEGRYLENEYDVRIDTYNKMLSIVKSKLDYDEEIVISKINIPYKSGSGGMSVVLYYQGLFFTNKRLFIFNMNFKYEEIEDMKVKNVEDISLLIDQSHIDGVRIEFADTDRIFIKSYSNEENELTLIMVKFLLEKGVEFSKRNKVIEKLFY